jgi:predicted phage baseplate assembly protein
MTAAVGLICRDELRRGFVRRAGQNGLDHVEVSDDHRTLTVSFLAKAPAGLGPGNVKITGGQRVTGITALAVRLCADDDPEIDDCIQITVSQPGDASCYQLGLVEADAQGHPTDVPLAGLDPRYALVSFSFMVGCPTGLDCAAAQACPPRALAEPDSSYLAKDFASFRQLLLDRLALIMPAWKETHEPDIGMAIVELLSWVGDELSYYQDAVGTEAYLQTARLRISVRRHLTLIDYRMHDGCNARTWVCVELTGTGPVTLQAADVCFITTPAAGAGQPALLRSDLSAVDPGSYLVFEPLVPGDVVIYPAHSEMYFWTWGDGQCCLPAGATAATLTDAWAGDPPADDGAGAGDRPRALHLHPGDVIIIEEIAGPLTGSAADADPRHRQAVRLTAVEPTLDPLFGQPVVNVQWSAADALTFPVCVSSLNSSTCAPVCPVSVARGNVILVDHGRSLTACGGPPETLTVPPPAQSAGPCQGPYQPGPPITTQAPSEPELARSPVTQRQPFPDPGAVARRQAHILEAIPGAALAAARAVLAGVTAGRPLDGDQIGWLTTLFGTAALISVGLLPPIARPGSVPGATGQASALAALLAQQETLLDHKLRRLQTLARRARAGLQLAPEVAAEITASWGSVTQGLDPAGPALFGPAATALSQNPRAALPEVSVRLVDEGPELLPPGAATAPWVPRRTLLASSGEDRHFVGESDDNGVLHLRFGDGTLGQPPEPGATLAATYRVGNGTTGNASAGTITTLVSCTTGFNAITRVRNPLSAQGGTDPEPSTAAQLYAPAMIGEPLRRAVTADDYAAIAAEDTSLQRAAAQLRWAGSWYEAHVALDPAGTEVLDQSLARSVTTVLRHVRRLGHDLRVEPAEYVPLDIAMQICVLPGYQRAHVEAALMELLGSGTSASGQPGLFSPDNLTFGTAVSASKLIAVAAGVAGVESAAVTRLQRLGQGDDGELAVGVLTTGPLQIPQLDNDPRHPERGVLQLVMGGGR